MRRTHTLLLFVLALAAFLRCTGIGWGLRHIPDPDERVFVERTRDMNERGGFDPGWYEYPGLVFWLLRGVFAAAPAGLREGAGDYLLARGLIAAFSLASVALVWLLGRRLLGERAGLVAALWLAVSPVEVQTAHMFRPDVVLGTCALLALLAFSFLGSRLRQDVLAGLALGACLATKFTGAAMGPAWLAARLLAPGRRWAGLLLGGAAAAALLLAATPRLVFDPIAILEGARSQAGYMYDAAREASRGTPPILYYAQRYVRSLGPLGAGLFLAGLATIVRTPRPFAPALLYAAGLLAVLGSAEARFERLIVSSLGIAALLAARGLAAVEARWPRAALPLAALAVTLPGVESLDYALALRQPLTRDRALDWIEAELPKGARVVSGIPDLGIDRFTYDVAGFSGEDPLDGLAAARADAVVLLQGDPRAADLGLETRHLATPATAWSGAPILLLRARHAARFVGLEALARPPRTEASRRGGVSSVEIELRTPRETACVELRFEPGGGPPTRRLRLEARAPGSERFQAVTAIVGWSCGAPARPGERRRALVFAPRGATALRVRLDRDNRLRLADARVFGLASD